MIVSCRDKRTRDFAAGKRVKAFSGFQGSAQLKLDRLEAAVSVRDLAAATGRASTASASTISGGSVSSGRKGQSVRSTLRSSTITRRTGKHHGTRGDSSWRT